jgi:hypothetical protein
LKRLAILLLILLVAAPLAAEELGLFTGEAEVELGEINLAAAKVQAKKQALADAVEKAVVQVAPPEELELKRAEIKRQILRAPMPYIVSFSVLKEETKETTFRLAVEARVRLDALRDAVRALAVTRSTVEPKKTFAVLPFYERAGGYSFADGLDGPLRERFELAGKPTASRRVAESLLGAPSFARAAEGSGYEDFARAAEVNKLKLVALIELRDDTKLEDVEDTCDQTAFVRLVDAPERAVIATFRYAYPKDEPCSRLDETAGSELFGAIMDRLAGEGKLGDTGPANLVVELIGVRGYDQLQEIQALIRNRAYVQEATLDSFEPGGRVRFRVVYGGSPEKLVEDLVSIRGSLLRIEASGSSGNLLQFTVETR